MTHPSIGLTRVGWPRLTLGLVLVWGLFIKAVVAPEPGVSLPIVWMAAYATLPLLAFLVPRSAVDRP